MTRLFMFRGDDESFNVAITEADGSTAVNLSGAALRFVAKRRITDLDADAVIDLSTGNSTITVTNEAAGLARLDVPAGQTNDLTKDAFLLWDLQITDISDKVRTVASGDLIVKRDVTRTVP